MIKWQAKASLFWVPNITVLGILIEGRSKVVLSGDSEAECCTGNLTWADQSIKWSISNMNLGKYKLSSTKVNTRYNLAPIFEVIAEKRVQ